MLKWVGQVSGPSLKNYPVSINMEVECNNVSNQKNVHHPICSIKQVGIIMFESAFD